MRHDPILAPTDAADLHAACKRLLVSLIDRESDLTEKKVRIMTAWETGFLTSQEAEEWIVLGGMVNA